MASPKAAWGIEVGSNAIKAVRLEREGDEVTVTDFAIIPHKKVLSTPDLDQDEMIRLGLGQFISQKAIEGEHLVMSVPGHSAFARFAKLPPVEPRKVPDIVKFEAVQQIPFPIEEVEWDYQTFASEDSPEVEVGIFAITRLRVRQRLDVYSELGISPEMLTLSPVAVYNSMAFDHRLSDHKGPVVYLDIGTSATDVVIADRGRCWIRTFPLGGSHFTEAIARAFKLGYSKAERLKQEAATSKYAKQIMQAMRPVFTDLLQDLQRSIGYFQSLNRDSELNTMVGLGSTFKIPGLRKFLGQQLQINVVRLDEFKRISVRGREAASFAQNAVGMATAYGLALQGVGLAQIDVNLVPVETLRVQMWHDKTKWFAAAAALGILGGAMLLYRPITDRSALQGALPAAVTTAISEGTALKKEFEQAQSDANVGYRAENYRRLIDYRNIWPHLIDDAAAALASTNPQPELLSGEEREIASIDPKAQRLVRMTGLDGVYSLDGDSRQIHVTLGVELSHDRPQTFLNDTVATWLRENAEPIDDRAHVPYRISDVKLNLSGLQTLRVDADGETETIGAGSGQNRPPRKTGGGGRDGEMPGKRTPPSTGRQAPPGPGGSGFGMGAGEGGRGGMPGRRERPQGTGIAPPGPGGTGMSSSGGDGAPPAGGRPGGAGSPPTGGRGGANAPGASDLEELAPTPKSPQLYPPDTRFFRLTITFSVELLDQPIQPPTDSTVRSDNQEAGS